MIRPICVSAVAALVLNLAGCGEKPQTGATVRKTDTPAWQAAENPFVAPGWTAGDNASWEAQLRERARRGQNEYTRVSGQTQSQ